MPLAFISSRKQPQGDHLFPERKKVQFKRKGSIEAADHSSQLCIIKII